MRGLRSDKAVVLFFKGLIAFVVWGALAFGVWRLVGGEWRTGGDVSVFDSEASLYTVEFPFLDPPLDGGVYIRGKAVVADVTDGVVLPQTFHLAPEIAAREPSEVGTIIQVMRLFEEAGTYNDGTPAYRQNALVRLVDLRLECAIGEAFVQGDDPPVDKEGDGPGFGEAPDEQIPALVAHLPRYTMEGVPVAAGANGSTARGGRPTVAGATVFVTRPYGDGDLERGGGFDPDAGDQPGHAASADELTERLVLGMTVEDAIALMGPPLSRSQMGGGNTRQTQCTWQLPDGHILNCRFRANGLQDWEEK